MQAIVTRYFGPTDCRGSKVKATCQAGTITVSWDNSLDVDGNHRLACEALCRKLQWPYTHALWVGGGAPDGAGQVYVNCMRSDRESPVDVLETTIMSEDACCMDNADDVRRFVTAFAKGYGK